MWKADDAWIVNEKSGTPSGRRRRPQLRQLSPDPRPGRSPCHRRTVGGLWGWRFGHPGRQLLTRLYALIIEADICALICVM